MVSGCVRGLNKRIPLVVFPLPGKYTSKKNKQINAHIGIPSHAKKSASI